MKIKITTTIDHIVKANMDIILAHNKMKWTNFLHEACIEYIGEQDAKAILEIEFNEKAEKLAELRQEMHETELSLQKLQIEIVDFKSLPNLDKPKQTDNLLTVNREKFFQLNKDYILSKFADGTEMSMTYKSLITKGGFNNEKDAYTWLVQRVHEHEQTST